MAQSCHSKVIFALAVIIAVTYFLQCLLLTTQEHGETKRLYHRTALVEQSGLHEGSPLLAPSSTQPSNYYHQLLEVEVASVISRVLSEGDYPIYILSLQYSDQQTAALKNLLSLQCWASSVNALVIEPSMVRSQFATPLQVESEHDVIRFSDIFDVVEWNDVYVRTQGFLPFAKFESFLQDAPRKIVFVQITQVPTKQAQQQNVSIVSCHAPRFCVRYQDFMTRYKFTVVREVCILLGRNAVLTTEQFTRLVFAGLSRVTVIFKEWRGISLESDHDEHTFIIRDSQCSRRRILPHVVSLSPSQRVLQDAHTYIQKYLKGGAFVAVMVRLEYAVRYLHRQNSVNVENCLRSVLSSWSDMVETANTTNTFLSLDIGKFGSYEFEVHKNQWNVHDVSEKLKTFYKSIYAKSFTITDWENTFTDVSGTTNQGYIAILQKAIAIHGKCLLLAGGGSFQLHALKLKRNINPKSRCHTVLHAYPCRVTHT